jgi:hypothetical protein
VFVSGLEPFFVDVDILVEERFQLGLQRGLQLIYETLDEIVLTVAVADEAGMLEGHDVGAANLYQRSTEA